MTALDSYREVKPTNRRWLWSWIKNYTGVSLAHKAVCRGHQAPFDPLADQFFHRPSITLTLGSRGSGKSFTAGIGSHLDSRFLPGHGTRILGGSKDQSRQIYEALQRHIRDGRGKLGGDEESIASLLKESASYRNGSNVSILAASDRSVRGPHIPKLRLDEVDEIKDDLREAAMGMCMSIGSNSAAVDMTSTWHRPQGPMANLIERAKSGEFPLYTYCVFEVLERCPTSRSGINLEKCTSCPIVAWCHEDRVSTGDLTLPPKAKLSNGHYSIESLIQKVKTTSKRVFEADYLCKGPKADGIWFTNFDPAKNVTIDAVYNPRLPVWRAIDSGVFTGAVWFQLEAIGSDWLCTVFADYLSEGLSAEVNAREIHRITDSTCGLNPRAGMRTTTDPAGKSRNAIGPSVISEYERVIGRLEHWPLVRVPDSLALLEPFVADATGKSWLKIHPSCKQTINGLLTYQRGGKAPQWSDYPKDPQHPAEDIVDALRGGLCSAFPNGRQAIYRGPTTKGSLY